MINTVDDIVSGLSVKQHINFQKNLAAAKAAGSLVSGWKSAGMPGAGSNPPLYTDGSGYICDKSTPGAIPLTNAALKNYAAKLALSSSLSGTLIVADRLWSCSGMGFAASTYPVTTPGSLPSRITDNGAGVQAFVENFEAAGAATGSLTLNYLNTVGAESIGIISSVVSAPLLAQLQPIPLQVGDVGISQVTSVTTSATWTSGTFGITLLKRLFEMPVITGVGTVQDWAQLGLAEVPNDACLMLLWQASSVSAPVILGSIDLIDK